MKIGSSTMESVAAMHYNRSEESRESVRIQNTATRPAQSKESPFSEEETLDPKLRAIVNVLERLMGKKITVTSFRAEGNGSLQLSNDGTPRVGWGMEAMSSYSLHEDQSLAMGFSGKVITEEGKEMSFSLNLQFSREFNLTQSTTFRSGDALSDPLVISLDGSSPIGTGKFAFDLIEGGGVENIPLLAGENGFLTLDKNRDGKVSGGSELFGPKSGNGFSELAQLDDDKNGWIDENDSQFKALKLWIKTDETDRLVTLKEVGIGALSLQALKGEFDFKDSSNATQARLQNTSVALTESGEAKAVFGLDVAI
ncbi:MAG: hypothetical protein M0P91_08930 [Sulfuricurvum sp.]|uniref:hypothetical protein n=1 Tax=Sulfuricurvum sp. TaxID=2025608 RepID=UPI0025EA4E48|nr:hypothetical protein [Sulfuricurvum sp.]MCK9373309.1 hypothetical protein [Sulfuricurvum sp.]